jgi:hypothetical protein
VIFIERAATFLKDMLLRIAICFSITSALWAQQPNLAPPNGVAPAGGLKVVALEGQNGANNTRMPMPMDLVVEVRDGNDRPLEGVTVNFQLPLMGPSGGFEGGVRNKETVTNVQGQASVSYTPNEELGRFTIQVKATQGGRTGVTTIMQQNTNTSEAAQTKGWFSRHKKIVIAAVVVVAVGVGLGVGLTRGGSKSGSSGSGITITPGVPTVAGPQ